MAYTTDLAYLQGIPNPYGTGGVSVDPTSGTFYSAGVPDWEALYRDRFLGTEGPPFLGPQTSGGSPGRPPTAGAPGLPRRPSGAGAGRPKTPPTLPRRPVGVGAGSPPETSGGSPGRGARSYRRGGHRWGYTTPAGPGGLIRAPVTGVGSPRIRDLIEKRAKEKGISFDQAAAELRKERPGLFRGATNLGQPARRRPTYEEAQQFQRDYYAGRLGMRREIQAAEARRARREAQREAELRALQGEPPTPTQQPPTLPPSVAEQEQAAIQRGQSYGIDYGAPGGARFIAQEEQLAADRAQMEAANRGGALNRPTPAAPRERQQFRGVRLTPMRIGSTSGGGEAFKQFNAMAEADRYQRQQALQDQMMLMPFMFTPQ